MNYDLTQPCSQCPFRTDKPFPLKRSQEIADGLLSDRDFACHKTVNYDDPQDDSRQQMCAGAMIVLEKLERPTQMMRIMERLGGYDMRRLNMKSPVYDDLDEFVDGTTDAFRDRLEG